MRIETVGGATVMQSRRFDVRRSWSRRSLDDEPGFRPSLQPTEISVPGDPLLLFRDRPETGLAKPQLEVVVVIQIEVAPGAKDMVDVVRVRVDEGERRILENGHVTPGPFVILDDPAEVGHGQAKDALIAEDSPAVAEEALSLVELEVLEEVLAVDPGGDAARQRQALPEIPSDVGHRAGLVVDDAPTVEVH